METDSLHCLQRTSSPYPNRWGRGGFLFPPGDNPHTVIEASAGEELSWRRSLWESFYPRIRKQDTPEAAAEIVVRYFRERVTISPEPVSVPGVESIWRRQIADEKGFETIYVAALRSVGVPARLDATHKTEFWDGKDWRVAPRLLISTWKDLLGQ